MPSSSQKRRLGIFIVLVIAMLAALLVIIGTGQLLKEQDTYLIAYEDISVSGLEIGSPVKYLGLGVGTIKEIKIDPQDINRIILRIAVKKGTPIKEDAVADIELLGITGLKMIEIRGGSSAAELLEPGAYIHSGKSVSEIITGKAEIIMEKIELLVNNLNQFTKPDQLKKITDMAENADRTFTQAAAILRENRDEFRLLVSHTRKTISSLDTIAQYLSPSPEELASVSLPDTLTRLLSNLNALSESLKKADMNRVIGELALTLDRSNRILSLLDHDIEMSRDNLFISLQKLRSTLEYLDETARMVNRDPSILLRGTEYKDLPDENLEEE